MAKKIGEPLAGLETEVTETATATATEAVASGMAAFEQQQSEVRRTMEKTMKTAEELVAFSQGNLEALVKSGQVWAAGVQDLSRTVAASAQAQFEELMATFKALAGAKSLKEAVELQTTLTRASMEKVVAESGKLTEAGLKLAEQTWAPVTARIALATEKFGRLA